MKGIVRTGLALAALTGMVGLFSVRTAAPADGQAPALAERVAQLEERMAALEARVAALDGGAAAAGQSGPPAQAAPPQSRPVLIDVSGQTHRSTDRFEVTSSAIEICWEITSAEREVYIILYRVTQPTMNLSHTAKAGETRCVTESVSPGTFYLSITPLGSNSDVRFRVWARPA